MAMQKRNFIVRDDSGAIVAGPTVTVYESGTLNFADLFSDDLVVPTPLANPLTGGADGRFGFYTPDGLVDIVVEGDGIDPYTLTAELFDYTLNITPASPAVESINGETDAAQTLVEGSAGTDFSIVSAAGVHTFNLPTASGAARGLLSPVHWTSFNQRLKSLNGLSEPDQTFVVGSAGTDFNISGDGISIHRFNLPTASATQRGALSSADWNTFNNKQNAIVGGTALQYIRGDMTAQTLNTAVVPESGNLYHTTARARAALASPTAPLSYNSSTGVFSIPAASGAQDGYLSAANWNTFNNKLGSLGGQTGATQTFASGTAGTDFAISSAGNVHTFNLPDAGAAARGVVSTGTQTFAGAKTLSGRLTTGSGRNRKTRVVTVAGDVTVATSDDIVVVNKSVGAATAVNLPATPSLGDVYVIKDGKGDASGNAITITPDSGTIDGDPNLVISADYGSATVVYNGTEWNAL